MAQFNPDLLLELAKTADKRGEITEPSNPVLAAKNFSHDDNVKINEFKDALFMLVLLRARNFLIKTNQNKYAITGVNMIMFSGTIHPDDFEGFMGKANVPGLEDFGPIPRLVFGSPFDDGEAKDLVHKFNTLALALACK